MKKIPLILISFSLLIFASFDMQPYLTAELNAAEETLSLSQCSCNLKEALKEGDWQKAKESAENIITTSPNSPEAKDAYLWLGLYHKSQHDFSKSTKFYQKAEELFPNTWASAEATARIGCNYYKLNNYSKALEYYRKAASEAQTWQQRKYASAWAKWVHFNLAGGERQLVANCATKSIDYYLNSKGIKLDNKKLASSLTLKDGLVPLSEILKFLKKENIKLKAVKCPLDKIKDLPLPFVAAVRPSHLIVIKDIEKDTDKKIKRIRVYDPVQGEISYYKKELADIWAEKVLTISTPAGRKFASLKKKELDNILLGSCYCCPTWITPCEEGSDDCCKGAESGPGGPPSGPGGPGGPGGPCRGGCYGGVGFPRITVYTSALSLIIRDTPIGYITALGEDVKVSITFNSDLWHSGIFGSGWHSNLETKSKRMKTLQ
jgi:tetratricopeptide (TPR) repeat protein